GSGDPRSGNYNPDCDLLNTAANGECGALTSNGFGTTRVNTIYASDVLNGWQVRPFNWQTTAIVQQEIRPGTGLTIGYYRSWYGGFRATWNQAAIPADFSSFCVTQPVDQRSSALTGATVCGFKDISVTRFGKTDNVVTPGATYQNVVTRASNFGDQKEVFNGLDV